MAATARISMGMAAAPGLLYLRVKQPGNRSDPMAVARLSSKSQIVIPAEARRELGLQPGDELLVEIEQDRIVIRKRERASALERLEAYCGDHWRGAAEEIRRERDLWDGRG
jgi:AbrB family looped-hinge helix DNA binding protein